MDTVEPDRIISLLPAATEILCELGVGDRLVGISEDCDWPERALNLPSISSTIVDTNASSRSIDRQVREAQHDGRSIYHVDQTLLDELDPDLVVTQEQCDVCAPKFEDVRDSCRRLEGSPEVLSLEPTDLQGVIETIKSLAEVVGIPAVGKQLIDKLLKRQDRIQSTVQTTSRSPCVACIEWMDPIFVGGHWVPEMVEKIGGRPLGTPGQHSCEIDWDAVVEHDPQIIVLMPCGFGVDRAQREGTEFLVRIREKFGSDFSGTSIYAVDGSSYYSRPGPRLWDGMALLAGLFYSEHQNQLDFPEKGSVKLE